MSILSQIGIIIIIGFIVVVLVRSNKLTEQAAQEGEHFSDEWQDYQNRKMELKAERIAAKEIKAEQKRAKKIKRKQKGEELFAGDACAQPRMDESTVEGQDWTQLEGEQKVPGQSVMMTEEEEEKIREDKIFKIHQSPSKNITLIRMDENHYPIQKIVVDKIPFTIGRGKQNCLVLDDLCVAREHCQIIEVSGKLLLKDRGTANKIYTDGRTYEEVELYDRQRFYLGNEEILVEIEEGASSFKNYHSMEA